MCACLISWGPLTHTSWPCVTCIADLVQKTTHFITLVRYYIDAHHLHKGTLGNTQVAANLAQISRLLEVEFIGTRHLQGREGLSSGRESPPAEDEAAVRLGNRTSSHCAY